ncbi:MAG: hypothetical protein R3316_00435 [Rhodovibrionaceae bacterium]|nr:hypothetical protein [Rhodovibrionaceae bacterium]
MRALKVLVFVMGLAILVGFAVVVITIATRLDDGKETQAGFGRAEVGVPEGCVVAEIVPADERLLLRIDGPEARGCRTILVLDLETGARLGQLDLTDAPAGGARAEGGSD